MHVTLRSRIAPLRSQFLFPSVRLALMRATRRAPDRFRIVHFSVQRDHAHFIVEAADKRALSNGVRGLAIRITRYVNDVLGRRGALWADRWYGRALTSPREVRNCILYVLANARKHAHDRYPAGIDPYSSGEYFTGWREWHPGSGVPPPFVERADATWPSTEWMGTVPLFESRTWLASVGWRRRGLIGLAEGPRP